MQTSIVKGNGVRDSTEERLEKNYAVEYAKRLVEQEMKERIEADTALGKRIDEVELNLDIETNLRETEDEKINKRITTHENETATDKRSSHVFLSDAIDSDKNAASGKTAATPLAVKKVNDALAKEAAAREAADVDLGKRIDAEAAARAEGDTALGERIDAEASARAEEDGALDERLKIVEEKAHTHENKDILDGIDADRVRKWDDGAEGQITRGEYLEHLAEADRQFDALWDLLGMTVYDGGWYGMAQLDAPLDGGLFEDTALTPLDFGDFGKFVPSGGGIGDIVDGGIY